MANRWDEASYDQEAPEGLRPEEEAENSELEVAPEGPGFGYILDEPDETKVAKHIVKDLLETQEKQLARDIAVSKVCRWWREGKRWVKLEKKENQTVWTAKLPAGMASAPPIPNKTNRLCVRTGNTLLVDDAYPDCEAGDNSSEAKEGAEFSRRYLVVKGSVTELNMPEVMRDAFDLSATYMSAFGWVITDPTAGGSRPRRMLAHPMAQSEQDALLDPATGMNAQEEELVERYLRPDGSLTDNPTEAEDQWLPGPRIRLLNSLQVRFIPDTAPSLAKAEGCIITDFTTLGDLRARYPDAIEALDRDELQKLCSYKPKHLDDLLPPYTTVPEDQKDEEGNYRDGQFVVYHVVYYRQTGEYRRGCNAVVGGDSILLHRQKWCHLTEQEGKQVEECLMIPVAQQRCMNDTVTGNSMGKALAMELGPADEITASSLGYQLEYMFRYGNPLQFLPIGSIVQPKQLVLRNGDPVMVNPQGQPFTEQIPPFPAAIGRDLREEMKADQDDSAGLQQAAQGVEDPSVKSGIHAQTIVQEALKAVSHMRANLGFFFITLNTILLEHARAFVTVPQLLEFAGEDGEYKQREFSRTDFRKTKKVTIQRGSFTMHTLVAKQEMANNAFDRQVIDPDEYQELLSGGISPIVGMQENPHLLRIRRQIEAWKLGPPKGWMEQFAAHQQSVRIAQDLTAQNYDGAQTATQLGMPYIPAAVPAIQPPPPGAFAVSLEVDLEPIPAKIRHRQLSKEMVGSQWEKHPEPWKETYRAEYRLMKNAAGVITVPDMQKQKQIEAEGTAKTAQDDAASKATQEAEAAGFDAAERQRDRDADLQKETIRASARAAGGR